MVTQVRKQNDAVFRAIADPTRREILGLLRGGRRSVGDIAANFRISRPAISRHLRLLRSVGLIVTRKDGATRICAMNAKPLRAVGNCPGGDGQVQWNMQVISHLVDARDDPQRAVALPRVTVFPGSDADTIGRPPVLRCEAGLPEETLVALERWGHTVERIPVQRGGPGGSALAVSRDQDGVLHAAADPRMEGVALAL